MSLSIAHAEEPPSPDYVPGLEHPPSPEEDPTDYPTDEGDNDDDESSDDDDDDDDDEEEEEEQEASKDDDDKEEAHSALIDSSAISVDYPIPSAEDTEAFETDESAPTPVPSPR
ncbi:hypothetical protein Tco_1324307, partial [Tanacetum coccineum]